jgi:hypothetical protein
VVDPAKVQAHARCLEIVVEVGNLEKERDALLSKKKSPISKKINAL